MAQKPQPFVFFVGKTGSLKLNTFSYSAYQESVKAETLQVAIRAMPSWKLQIKSAFFLAACEEDDDDLDDAGSQTNQVQQVKADVSCDCLHLFRGRVLRRQPERTRSFKTLKAAADTNLSCQREEIF